MEQKVKIAGVQMEPILMEKAMNLSRCAEMIRDTVREGARLVVFPECTLTGYCFSSLEEAVPYAEPIPGPGTDEIAGLCRDLNVFVVVGLIEKDRDKYYNAAALLGPGGLVGKYRKLHLPYLGVDRFLNHGDLPLSVYETEMGMIGMGICYDAAFPEHSRALALQRADIVVLPTNWPQGAEFTPEHTIPTRARENRIFYVAINRVGEERGFKFFGRSKIVSCLGLALAEGKPYEQDILYAEIDPAMAREKHTVIIPGEFEVHPLKDRRPEFYGPLVDPLLDTSRIR